MDKCVCVCNKAREEGRESVWNSQTLFLTCQAEVCVCVCVRAAFNVGIFTGMSRRFRRLLSAMCTQLRFSGFSRKNKQHSWGLTQALPPTFLLLFSWDNPLPPTQTHTHRATSESCCTPAMQLVFKGITGYFNI